MSAYSNQWVVSLAPFPEPNMAEASEDVREHASALLELWRSHVPTSEAEGFGDFEDFFEQAARLQAAIETFGAANCWLYLGSKAARNLTSNQELPKQELLDLGVQDYGILHRWDHFDTSWQRGNDVGDLYISSSTFERHAGREMVVCGFAPDDPAGLDLRDALVDFARRHREALIKVGRAKHGFYWVDLPKNLTRDAADRLMWETMDMAPLNYEGRSNAFLLQAYASMSCEYRFFVVNNALVTGAGCVEEFTPLNNRSQFDDRMREDRKELTPAQEQPELLARYLDFAAKVVREFAEEGILDTYSLDVAVGDDGEPLIVELNGLPNSGLYASDPKYVTRALLSARVGA